ncbi:protein LIKE COV 2 isoform X2 [Gossypium raimondii]|uniref:protein LIKE COV 2 isoform X2 n=1 Tax=Gossypium raimondii TaxID=29730 RepID=UPI00227CC498|nr:protein LIKE COV 2 isoform X2 [Gossypium raimondii]
MAEEKESTSIPLSQAENVGVDPEDPAKSPPRPSSPNSSTRKACCFVLQSWVSKKFMTGCVVLFPVAVTFFITWWFIQFVDGFFSPLYERLGIDIFGLGFITSLLFVFFVGVFVSSWMGAAVFSVGEWVIKRMPFVRHLYSASKQISAAISPDQNTTAFKEVAIIRHPRVGEYAFGFITSSVVLQGKCRANIMERGHEPQNLMGRMCADCVWIGGWYVYREKMKMKSYAVFLSRQTIYTLVISSW